MLQFLISDLISRPYINDQVLDVEHQRIVETALSEFDSRKKLGGEEFSCKYRDQLLQEIEESYNNYKAHNDSKNIFKAANTPITIFVMWSVLYIFSQVLQENIQLFICFITLFIGHIIINAVSPCQSRQPAHVGSCCPGLHLGLHKVQVMWNFCNTNGILIAIMQCFGNEMTLSLKRQLSVLKSNIILQLIRNLPIICISVEKYPEWVWRLKTAPVKCGTWCSSQSLQR